MHFEPATPKSLLTVLAALKPFDEEFPPMCDQPPKPNYHILKPQEIPQNDCMEWKAPTIEQVMQIVQDDLTECDNKQREVFESQAVTPYLAPILRYGTLESVVVVARKGDEVIYWEDVEEGFNVSRQGPDGRILEHWCNQDKLSFVLNAWIEGRTPPIRVGPATSIR